MDIRKFFQPKTTQAPLKKRRIEDDDDDVIPESPDIQIKNKKKRTNEPQKSSKCKPSRSDLKEVKTTNLFGIGPIKRTEPVVKKSEPKVKNTETGIHSDDEFEKSLLEIDGLDDIQVINDKQDTPEPSSSKEMKYSSDVMIQIEMKDKKLKRSLSTVKPKTKEKSPTREEIKKNMENKISLNELKKEVKDTNKRKFEEFLENTTKEDEQKINKRKKTNDLTNQNHTANEDVTKTVVHDMTTDDSMIDKEADVSGHKKKRMNKSLNESALTDEERHERKIHSAALYQKYLNRTGPKHLGAKEMPEGAANCLKDCSFLLTGVLDSFERDDVVDAIKKYGGSIKNSISKKVTHVLAGEDAGPAKMAKAEELGIKIINEDEFLEIIEKSKAIVNSKKEKDNKIDHDSKRKQNGFGGHDEIKNSKSKKDHFESKSKNVELSVIKSEKSLTNMNKTECIKEKSDIKKEKVDKRVKLAEKDTKLEVNKKNHDIPSPNKINSVVTLDKQVKSESIASSSSSGSINLANNVKPETPLNSSMWVEKYKPQNLKQIIGQTGEASNVKKLVNWLTKWYVNRKAKIPKPSPWAKNDDGAYYKAALLSGPPGVGKTTTVTLVCKELGFDTVEFNASDTRSKTLIKEHIGELLTTTSLSGYAKGHTGKQAVTKKHVLVMDEVDGMAGNEDRGGLQELISLIKSASVPIICMCNDRNSQKMRSLVNYCYDLRFSRPKVEQIKAAMRSVCCKENIKVPPDVLGQLIVSANQDVRQTLNLLSMWAVDPLTMDAEKLTKDASVAKKDVKLGPWEAIRKVFSAEEHKSMSINDKSDLFFYDYSLSPLFVQENYLQVQPHCPKNEILDRISKASESIAIGDTIEKRIRSAQAWSLLPMQAMYSSVLPGHALAGHVAGQIQFPGWLGKNSRANKMHRLCQEIHAHTRLSTTGSKSSIFLDYAPHLRDAILKPLIMDKSEGIDRSLEVLESYHLLREDLESLTELSMWPGCKNPSVLVDPKVKAAMTRTYNKKGTALPYAQASIKRGKARENDNEYGDDDDDNLDDPDSDPESDALIKKKKSKDTEKSSSDKPSTSKARSSKGRK